MPLLRVTRLLFSLLSLHLFVAFFLLHLLIQFFIQKKRRAFTFYTSFDCIVNEGGVSSEGKYIFPLFSQGEMWQQERDQVVKRNRCEATCCISYLMESKGIAMRNFFSCKVKSLLAAVICLSIFSSVHAAELSITTGGKKGTYFQIGSDISILTRQHGLGLDVMESKGSLDNIDKLYEKKYNRLAIVQSDILEYLRSSDDHRLRAKAENIKMIIPLYNEEVHILAHDSIRDLASLTGKKVAIGPMQSGTAITASLLFKKSGVKPGQLVYSGGEEALRSLRLKAIDAMVYVSGYPVSLFSQITPADKLQLVPIMDRRIGGSYIMSCIPERTYTWQKGIVPTIAVKAVLASYDYDETQQGSKDVCEVGKIIYTNIDWLKRNGHSKWGNVRLNDLLDGWEKNGCIKDAVMSLSSANFR